MAGPNEAASDLGGRALHRLGVQRIAAEQVDLLQLRKEARARIATRHALHLVDRQRFAGVDLVGVELVAAVEMTRDQQHVAAHTFAACGREPVKTPALDELDELVLVRRQIAAERLAFVRGIDGDRAHRLRFGTRD